MNYKYVVLILVVLIIGLSFYLYNNVSPEKKDKKWYEKILM